MEASDFARGATYLRRGFRLIVQPELRRYVVIPILVNVLVFSMVIGIGIYSYDLLLDALLPDGSGWWMELARTLLWLLFVMIGGVIVYFTFTVFANLIAAPFNGLLAERVERLSSSATSAHPASKTWLANAAGAVANELRKLFHYLLLLAFGLVLWWVPVVNLAAPIYWVIVAVWMSALEYLSYPMENHGIGFREARKKLRQRRLLSLGFGASVVVVSFIPLVNFLVMPAAVAGATLMWREHWAKP